MKAYTDIEQSKVLAEILAYETADMHYGEYCAGGENYPIPNCDNDYNGQCCWSLAALYSLLPEQTDISKSYSDNCETIIYWCWNSAFDIETNEYDNPVDACVGMILKLKEKNLL